MKVIAPAGAPTASQNTTTINGANVGPTATTSATDLSTVVSSSLTLLKEQALDANCDGTLGTYGPTPITTGAIPGACIGYRITATNNSVTTNTNVHVFDTTPSFSTYITGGGVPAVSVTGGTVNTVTPVNPLTGYSGPLDFNVGTLAPGAAATCTFEIKIDQ